MKLTIDDLDETYKLCVSSGYIKEKVIDIELIKSLKFVAEKGLEFIKSKTKDIPKESTDWTFVFRDYYESLRGLIEAYLLFDGIEADKHQCKNAYLCFKHKDLELDWEFLETVRNMRNQNKYFGSDISKENWISIELKIDLYISALDKEVKEKIKETIWKS